MPLSKGRGDAMRSRIVEAVLANPGIHKSALASGLGIGWGTLSYHLRLLGATGDVQTWSRGREVRVFPPSVPSSLMPGMSMLQDPGSALILRTLRDEPDLGTSELAEAAGIAPRVLRRHLSILKDEGFIQCGEGVPPRYTLTQRMERTLARLPERSLDIPHGVLELA